MGAPAEDLDSGSGIVGVVPSVSAMCAQSGRSTAAAAAAWSAASEVGRSAFAPSRLRFGEPSAAIIAASMAA
jgi:hypothetical protein